MHITTNDSFTALARKANTLDTLDRALRQTLEPPLRDQVRFAELSHHHLVFLAASPVWASRLRLCQTDILRTAKSIGMQANSIRIKVTHLPTPAKSQSTPSKPLSAEVGLHLQKTAASTSDPELRALILKLASLAAPS